MRGKQITLIFVLQIVIISLPKITSAQEQLDIQGVKCAFSGNVSTTRYQKNIFSILGALTNQSSKSKFYQTSIGNRGNLVHGLYVCRPDLSLDTCNSCVTATLITFDFYCSNKKEAIVWYEECMARYSNRTISASLQTEPLEWNWGMFNVSRPDIFPAILNNTFQGIIEEASMPNNKGRLAFNDADFTPFERFYGMAWCTPDIKASECKSCLRTALSIFPVCCYDGLANFAFVLFPNCVLRYDTAQFIFTTLPDSPPPPPPMSG